MPLQPNNSDLIMVRLKEVEYNETQTHWKLMKKSEVENTHCSTKRKLKTILSICPFKRKMFPDGRLIKHKS